MYFWLLAFNLLVVASTGYSNYIGNEKQEFGCIFKKMPTFEANVRIQVFPLPGQGPYPQLTGQETLFTPLWGQGDDVTQPWEESALRAWREQQPALWGRVLGGGW